MPQPIDFQTEVARTTAADRIQQVAERAALAQAQRAADEAQRLQTEAEQSVHQAPEAQSEHVDEEARRRAPYGKGRKRNPAEDERPGEARPLKGGIEFDEGRRLDVSV